jgi:hypothetical protein
MSRETEGPKPAAGTTWTTKAVASAGVIAAMMLAVTLNVLSARHFKRWDFTRGGIYTLSDATKETLHALEEPIKVYVLLPSSDPLSVAVSHMLDGYRGESARIEVEATDPDRNPAQFLAIQQRFGVVAGKTDDGRIITDAQIIVVRGDRPHFITSHDLVEVDDADDARARPRIEQALTAAIRDVLAKEQPLACFTTGHGEFALEGGGEKSLAALRDRLVKNNFGVRTLAPVRGEKAEDAKLIDQCRLLVVADPDEHVPKEDVARWVSFVEKGGSALVVAQSQPDSDQDKYLALGIDDLVGLAGLKLDEGFVFELDPTLKGTVGLGETFTPKPMPHAITEGFIKAGTHAPAIMMTIATPLTKSGGGSGAPVPLLQTSDKAFGMRGFMTWKNHPSEPSEAGAGDLKGPLTVAWASELPKPNGSTAAHGPRMVVIGSALVLASNNWQMDELRGTAIFVQNAVSWLTARPAMLDIPKKPAFATAFHLSEDDLGGVFRRSVIYLPLTSLLAGAAIYLARRNDKRGPKKTAEKKPAKKKKKSDAEELKG